MSYWFKPARFWNWFAFYYPSSISGWFVTLVLAAAFVAIFMAIDYTSHSASDTLIGFAPWGVLILVIFDFLCFRFGQYPSWWGKKV